ncbi:hypothetical protein ACSFV5_14610 [Acinetobacter sp. HC8-3S]
MKKISVLLIALALSACSTTNSLVKKMIILLKKLNSKVIELKRQTINKSLSNTLLNS